MTGRCAYRGWPDYYVGVIVVVAALNLLAFVCCLYAIGSMLSHRSIRSNTFNLYVIFLLVPDSLNTFVTFCVGVYRFKLCGTIPEILGEIIDLNIFFYYTCNLTLNCLVAWELHSVLEKARKFSRTGPPPMTPTLLRVAAVYSYTILFVAWAMVDVPWSWWYRKKHEFGSPPGGYFSELQAISMVGGLMLAYLAFVVAIRIRISRKNMLPNMGGTRVVSMFFGRIIVVFLVFYFPTLGLLFYSSTMKSIHSHKYFWTEQSLQFLTALQSLMTLWVVTRKPDIHRAVLCTSGQNPNTKCRCFRRRTSARRSTTGYNSTVTDTAADEDGHESNNRSSSSSRVAVRGITRADLDSEALVGSAFLSRIFLGPDTETDWCTMDVYEDNDEIEIEFEGNNATSERDGHEVTAAAAKEGAAAVVSDTDEETGDRARPMLKT